MIVMFVLSIIWTNLDLLKNSFKSSREVNEASVKN